MGLFKNINSAWELKVALTPLLGAATEAEFRALLPSAETAGDKVWGSGSRLIRSGSAKDKLLSAAASPTAARKLLDVGQFHAARQAIVEAVSGLDNLY